MPGAGRHRRVELQQNLKGPGKLITNPPVGARLTLESGKDTSCGACGAKVPEMAPMHLLQQRVALPTSLGTSMAAAAAVADQAQRLRKRHAMAQVQLDPTGDPRDGI